MIIPKSQRLLDLSAFIRDLQLDHYHEEEKKKVKIKHSKANLIKTRTGKQNKTKNK